jgi:D-alanyl-D-alanine-carboxypeptidase/D-alanyl-D-alanine-endopeptidase
MHRLPQFLALLALSSAATAQQAPVVHGDYAAVLGNLRIRLHIVAAADGTLSCTLAVRQGARGIPCADFKIQGQSLSFSVPAVRATWNGSFSEDGAILTGTWDPGTQPATLSFERQGSPPAPPPSPPPPKVAFDSAMPPVNAADMQAVLTKDLEQALKTGALAPETMAGVSIGVLRDGVSRVFAFGTAKPDSIFEIGSITKTFTGLVLAQLNLQGKVALDEPVRRLLPKDALPAPAGAEITLLDLVTQHSGLPALPDNLHPADPTNPYRDYGVTQLYSFLRQRGVEKSADAGFLYSNLGVGLLGQALANRAGVSYIPNLSARKSSCRWACAIPP